jgi:AcrR family transcriptional regulator
MCFLETIVNERSFISGDALMKDRPITKGEQTRQAILDAAERLFLTQGYHGTSMRQIADGAGIVVAGIYNHFPGKESIFDAVLDRHQPYLRIAQAIIGLKGEKTAELIEAAARLAINLLLEDAAFFPLAMIDLQEFKGPRLVRFANSLVPAILGLINRLVDSGQVRRDLPTPVIGRMFAGMIAFYVLSEVVVFRSDQVSFALASDPGLDWIGGMVDIFLNGVLDT